MVESGLFKAGRLRSAASAEYRAGGRRVTGTAVAKRRRRPEGGLTRRLPAWSISPRNAAGVVAGGSHRHAIRAPRPATGGRRPQPPLHVARARRDRRHRRPGHHSARAHRRQGPSLRSVRFAALGLDAGSARATDGQLSDNASIRSRTDSRPDTKPSRGWIRQMVSLRRKGTIGESSAALRPRPELDPASIGPARSDPRTRQPSDEITDGHQEHVTDRARRTSTGPARIPGEQRRRSGQREPAP